METFPLESEAKSGVQFGFKLSWAQLGAVLKGTQASGLEMT
jgi:hypothetical protein